MPQAQPQHWVCRENMPCGTCGSCSSKLGHHWVWEQAHHSPLIPGGVRVILRRLGRKDRQSRKLTPSSQVWPYRMYTDHFSRLKGNASSAVCLEHPPRDQQRAVHATWQHRANPMGMKPGSCAGQKKAQRAPARGSSCRGANPTPNQHQHP